jgi:propionyl-CoA synthetase
VVGIPDSLKGHLPFAFVTLSLAEHPQEAIPSDELFRTVQENVRNQIGGIASLGGMIQGKGMIPKTRSGKTLRRVLRDLVENAVHGEFEKDVAVPSTIEDADAVNVARSKVKECEWQPSWPHYSSYFMDNHPPVVSYLLTFDAYRL